MPRLFSALELPADVALRLSFLRAPIDGARWVARENLHLTLRFFGDVSGPMGRDIIDELGTVEADPFELDIAGCGAFGGRQPTTIFASLKPSTALDRLQKTHDRIARALGLPRDPHPFHPHITLARCRGVPSDAVAAFLEAHGAFSLPSFPVQRFVVMSAKPHTGGGPYAVEASYPLGLADAEDEGLWDDMGVVAGSRAPT